MASRSRARETKTNVPGQRPSGAIIEDEDVLAPRRDAAIALHRTIATPQAVRPADILALQRSVGNRTVQRLLATRVDRPRAAQRLVPDSAAEIASEPFPLASADAVGADAVTAVDRAAESTGKPLPADVRGRFERSLGTDLSAVRVHTGSDSAEAAAAVDAKAYTVGQDIHFGAGHYAPTEPRGTRLLAHEIAHTVQQQASPAVRQHDLEVSTPGDNAELEADRAADAMMRGESFTVSQRPNAIRRDSPAGSAPRAPPSVLPQVVPIEFSLEAKGPKSEGYIKLNKASLKGQGKLSVSGAPEGAVNVGPTGGGKSSDGKTSGQVGVSADAKKTAQLEMTKKFDEMVNGLVKSVTGKDDALKTELFAKAKAEAKAGSKEASAKIGYDFGVDATIFGVGKATAAFKLTLAGLKYKPSEKPPVSATVLAAEASGKLALKWKKAFELLENHYDIEGSLEWGAEIEPNWEKIGLDAAKDVGVEAGVTLAIDVALTAGPPLLAGIIIAQGIYMAGEKGALFANINEGAIDARQAAMDYAQMMTGSQMSPTGPRAKAAVAQASAELAQAASSSQVSVPELMTELRKSEGPANFSRIHSQARQQMFSAYNSEVHRVIKAWRSEHYILAIWTRQEDDVEAAMKQVNIIFSH